MKHSNELSYISWDKDKKYPNRELLEDTKVEFLMDFNSMDEASLWLITYHPDLYMAHSVIATDNSEFSIYCVPQYYYGVYNTTDDNVVIMNEMANLIKHVHFNEPYVIIDED